MSWPTSVKGEEGILRNKGKSYPGCVYNLFFQASNSVSHLKKIGGLKKYMYFHSEQKILLLNILQRKTSCVLHGNTIGSLYKEGIPQHDRINISLSARKK